MNEQQKYKKDYHFYLIVIGIILCAVICCTMRSCANISDNSGRIADVEKQLDEAGKNQSAISSGISNAEKSISNISESIERSEEGITNAGDAITRLETYNRISREIIADSQRIIDRIQKRNEEQAKQN